MTSNAPASNAPSPSPSAVIAVASSLPDLSQQLRDPLLRLQAEIAELQDSSAHTRFLCLGTHHRRLARYPRSATAALRELTRPASAAASPAGAAVPPVLLPPRAKLDLHTGSTSNPDQRLLQFHAHCPSFRFVALWRSTRPMTRGQVEHVEQSIQAVLLAVKQADGKVARCVSPSSQQWVRGITLQHARNTIHNYLQKEHSGEFVAVQPPAQAPTLGPADSSSDEESSSSEDEADEPLLPTKAVLSGKSNGAATASVTAAPPAAVPPRSSPIPPTNKPNPNISKPTAAPASNGSIQIAPASSSSAAGVRRSTPAASAPRPASQPPPNRSLPSPPAPTPSALSSRPPAPGAASSSKSPVTAPNSGSRRIPKRALPLAPPPAPTGPRPIGPPSKKPKPSV